MYLSEPPTGGGGERGLHCQNIFKGPSTDLDVADFAPTVVGQQTDRDRPVMSWMLLLLLTNTATVSP